MGDKAFRSFDLLEGHPVPIPEDIAKEVQAAIHIAKLMNRMDGATFGTPKGEHVAALHRIFVEWLLTNRIEYYQMCAASAAESDERMEWIASLERDSYRCVICTKSDSYGTGVESHHICVRSYHGPERKLFPSVHHRSNRVTLCSEHHNLVTNPPGPQWHWRKIAPELFRLIGEDEIREKFMALQDRTGNYEVVNDAVGEALK